MDQKILSMISYITIFGWIIAYFGSKNETRCLLLIKHLEQSLGLFILNMITVISVLLMVLADPGLAILSYINVAFLILAIMGILNAANEKIIELPIIGKMFKDRFPFLHYK